ncbi:MAG: peptidoglycan editing factor PgeF [Bacteroidales bacterium]|nr:peptidoglycan editing factor PgeF [Bacteroidales bacterium]
MHTFETQFPTTLTEEIRVFKFGHLASSARLNHFVSLRRGGISAGKYSSLNLGLHTGDEKSNILKNRELLANAMGLPADDFVFAGQVHGEEIAIIGEAERGSGVWEADSCIHETDAMITNQAGICLMVLVADCVPVMLFDPKKRVIAAIHAGRKGTEALIVLKTIERMKLKYGCSAKDILAGIGPSIGPCCYEVDDAVAGQFRQSLEQFEGLVLRQQEGHKPHLDLWKANLLQLLDCGILPENIETAGICTQCNEQDYFSYRAGKGMTGRFASGICLL